MDVAAARRVIPPITKSLCDCEEIHSILLDLRRKFRDYSPFLISACSNISNLGKNFARILHLVLSHKNPFVDALDAHVDGFCESISHKYEATLNGILGPLQRIHNARNLDITASITRLEQSHSVLVQSLEDRVRETGQLIRILEVSEETPTHPDTESGRRSEDSETTFKRGQKDACKKLFDLGLLNRVVSDVTPLMRSIVRRDEVGVNLLLMAGADPHQESIKPDENTSVRYLPICAAALGPASIVDILLQYGADPLQMQPDGFNAIHIAAISGQTPTLKTLLGPDTARLETKAIGTSSGSTPLMMAVKHDQSSNMHCLVMMGADVDAIDGSRTTALHLAARKATGHAVSFLIQKKAKVNCKNNEGNTPLIEAVEAGHAQTVELLLSNGANGDIRNKKVMTPLLIVILQTQQVDMPTRLAIASLLLKHGVALEDSSLDYYPLTEAARTGSTALVELLLHHGASLNICPRDASGAKPPLYEAVECNHPEVVACLARAGASYAVVNSNCQDPLVMAISSGWLDLLKVLLRSLDINDIPGGAIATAIRSNQTSLIRILKRLGAGLEAYDEHGLRPLHIAVEMQHLDAVKILVAEGVESKSRTVSGKCNICARRSHTQVTGLTPRCVLHNLPKEKHEQCYKDIDAFLRKAEGAQ